MTAAGIFFALCNLYRHGRQDEIDECLDRGGCWDRQRRTCEFADQCRCTPDRCVRGPTGKLVLPGDRVRTGIPDAEVAVSGLLGDLRRSCGGETFEDDSLKRGGWVQRLDDNGSCCLALPGTRGDGGAALFSALS
jgi:hypothetical protein